VTSESGMGRREFVGLLAASGAAVVVGAREVLHGRASAAPAVAGVPTRSRAPDGVVVLGKAYLAAHPHEANRRFLLAHLPGIDAQQPVRGQLRSLLPTAARDFGAGRVVTVQGWQLSRTEARAAAAVALGA
jgi:hypothetical protein